MLGCKRACRKCYPNGCFGFCKPPPQVQQQNDINIHLEKAILKKETPYGFVEIYPGVRTSNNNYTCPMLAVHLYRHSEYKANIATDRRTIIVDNKNKQIDQGPQKLIKAEEVTGVEEVRMLPVEDVLRISSKVEMKKGIQADVTLKVTPVYEESTNDCDRCCASIFSCCRKIRDSCCYCCQKEIKIGPDVLNTATLILNEDPNREVFEEADNVRVPEEKEDRCTRCCNHFRCWCCRKMKLVSHITQKKTVAEREAKRVVTITIECIPYSNLDSASNPHLLNSEQKLAVYKDQFKLESFEFYLINSTEFDPEKFKPKREQAETLCRTVMQLKAMRDHYPSVNELNEILKPVEKTTFGDEYKEPTLQLQYNPQKTIEAPQTQELSQPHRPPAITQNRNARSEYHEETEKKVIEQDINIRKDDS